MLPTPTFFLSTALLRNTDIHPVTAVRCLPHSLRNLRTFNRRLLGAVVLDTQLQRVEFHRKVAQVLKKTRTRVICNLSLMTDSLSLQQPSAQHEVVWPKAIGDLYTSEQWVLLDSIVVRLHCCVIPLQ